VNVFVYGTLLSGEPNHARLRGARLVAATRTEPRYTLVSLGPYPALIEGGTTSVTGEVYDVDVELLSALDRFEGVPGLYRRTAIHLLGGGVAQAYALAGVGGKRAALIPGGDWREYRRRASTT
jgi:gamma-glutamylaminecyclotransferase